jgi:hypothetical protein
VHPPDEHVAQRFAAGVGVLERLHGRGHRLVGGGRHGVDKRHGFLAAADRRDGRLAIRILLEVPGGERLVVAALAGMEKAGRRCCHGCRGRALGVRRGGRFVSVGLVVSWRIHGDNQGAIGVANDIHEVLLLALRR